MLLHTHLNGLFFALAAGILAKQTILGASAATAVIGAIHLVERRQSTSPLHPARQIAISTLLESMPEAVFLVDTDGRIVEANQAVERLSGIPRTKLLHMHHGDLAKYVAGPSALADDPSRWSTTRALRGESVRQERRRFSTPTGAQVEFLVTANPIREADGRIVGAMVILRDISELAQLQEHMADVEKHNVIGTMAASLAHDFNNVLDTINKAASLLEVAPDRPVDERSLIIRMIQNAVKRGSEIVGNVRQYLTGHQVSTDNVDLNTLLEESIELTRPMWQGQRNVSIVRQFQPIPRVRANAAEMRRIFANLIINALEAMPEGGTLVVGGERDGAKVLAYVQDSGHGISPQEESKVFQPYYTTKKQGTGLGLSSALKSVRAEQGDITFVSRPGEGTRFTVELPALSRDEQPHVA